jgi:hypothetical protein
LLTLGSPLGATEADALPMAKPAPETAQAKKKRQFVEKAAPTPEEQ